MPKIESRIATPRSANVERFRTSILEIIKMYVQLPVQRLRRESVAGVFLGLPGSAHLLRIYN